MDSALPPSRLARWCLAGVVFVGAAALLIAAYRRFPVLYDTDGYYHLAVARLYAERGIVHALDWARFSVMHDGFGDKELLFHLLLVPFVRLGDPTAGGFLALALLGATIAAALAIASIAAVGRWGVALPLLVLGTATDFSLRLVRLRPELLALLLIVGAISLAARRRAVLLGFLGAAYALAYTAFHALLGLCALFWLYGLWVERRNDWRLLAYPLAGVAVGLLVHPQFPANLRVWVVQNVSFLLHQGHLDVGPEIQARTTRDVLLLNLGWLAGLTALWRSRVGSAPATVTVRARDLTLIAAIVFGVLYLLSARFVVYLVPLATLALVRAMGASGTRPGPVVRLPWRGGVPLGLAMGLCLLGAIPATSIGWTRLVASTARSFRPEMRPDWEAFGRAMPEDGKVFAPWAPTEAFVFWAPRAQYLNVLDPVFMYAKDPALYRLAREILEGREPDVPLVARTRFDSDLFADDGQYPIARARLQADPRVTRLHEGISYLYRLDEGRNGGFLLDWKVLPADDAMPPPLARVVDPATPRWPRADDARAPAIEGYVDGRRLGRVERCVTFARAEDVTDPVRRMVELAPYGSAEVFLDDAPVAAIPPRAAILGRGVVLGLVLEPGMHRLTVRTCPSEGQLGFYALVRGGG